jgi:hypothetical protein
VTRAGRAAPAGARRAAPRCSRGARGPRRMASPPPAAALQDAQRLLEDLVLHGEVWPGPGGEWGSAPRAGARRPLRGAAAAAAPAPNTAPPSAFPQRGGGLWGGAAPGISEVITFDDGSSGGGSDFERIGSSGSPGGSSGGGGGGAGFGGGQRRALEAAISQLRAATAGGGGGGGAGVAAVAGAQGAAAAAAAALAVLSAPGVDADDLLACEGWPDLCEALPHCLLAQGALTSSGPSDAGGGGGGAAPAAAAAAVLRRQGSGLLDCAPAAMAQLLLPLLQRLAACGVAAGAAAGLPALDAPLPPQHQRPPQQPGATCGAGLPAAPAGAAPAAQPGQDACVPERVALVFALRALHALGRGWHFLPADVAAPLCGAIIGLALQGAAGAGGGGGGGGGGRAAALEALLWADPDMLWWRRLVGLAAFQRCAIEQVAATGSAGDGGVGGRGPLARALLPLWRGDAAPAGLWQRAAAAAVTQGLAALPPRALGALLGAAAGDDAGGACLAAARAWLAAEEQRGDRGA